MVSLTPEPDRGDDQQCEIVIYPSFVDSLLVRLCRELYGDPGNFFSPYVSGMLQKYGCWSQDPSTLQTPGLAVEIWSHWKPELVEARPGIFIRDLGYKRTPLGLGGDRYSEEFSTGKTSHYTQWSGSVMAMHVSNVYDEVKALAWETAKSLAEISTVVTFDTSLTAFEVLQAGDPRPLKESQMHFAAPVVVNYTCPHSWDLMQDLPLLKKIDFEAAGGVL